MSNILVICTTSTLRHEMLCVNNSSPTLCCVGEGDWSISTRLYNRFYTNMPAEKYFVYATVCFDTSAVRPGTKSFPSFNEHIIFLSFFYPLPRRLHNSTFDVSPCELLSLMRKSDYYFRTDWKFWPVKAIMASVLGCCLRWCGDGGSGHVPLKEMPAVQLDTHHMGTDVVIVKSGRRICGTGGCLANAPLHQNKSYFEFKIQSTG
ncbi:uncharacterized protein LOC121309192 [Polyodon spathula]|uniref:uncharacterized protein LOC121309192 n=1 Tax=Polyodon spathula TaxID=7913 RepID=UPI001B7E4445|nr:uncharacterized protein LOC121309192 [Polyodon spathula]